MYIYIYVYTYYMCGCVCRARDSPPMRSYRRRADCPFGGGDDSRRRWLDNFSFDKRHADNDYDDDKIIITRKKLTSEKNVILTRQIYSTCECRIRNDVYMKNSYNNYCSVRHLRIIILHTV